MVESKMAQTYYDYLNVSPKATTSEIEAAFHKLLKKYHPDVAPKGMEAKYTEITQKLLTIRSILLNPVKRAEYNKTLNNSSTVEPNIPAVVEPTQKVNVVESKQKVIKTPNFMGIGSYASIFIVIALISFVLQILFVIKDFLG